MFLGKIFKLNLHNNFIKGVLNNGKEKKGKEKEKKIILINFLFIFLLISKSLKLLLF